MKGLFCTVPLTPEAVWFEAVCDGFSFDRQ